MVERIGGAWWRSAKRKPQELVHTQDMAPTKNWRRFVSCGGVGIIICERVNESLMKCKEKAVRRTLYYGTPSRHMLRTQCSGCVREYAQESR